MKKRKILSVILSLLLVSGLPACNGDNKVTDNKVTENNETENKGSVSDISEDDTASPEIKVLENVTHYPGEDERILHDGAILGGGYEQADYYNSTGDNEKKAEFFSKLHYHEIEDDKGKVESYSIEPVWVDFGYFCPSDSRALVGFFSEVDLDNDQLDELNSLAIGGRHVRESTLRAIDRVLYQRFDAETAVGISENIRKLCDMNFMAATYYKENTLSNGAYTCSYVYEIEGDKILYAPYTLNQYTMELSVPPKDEWKEMSFGFRDAKLVLLTDGYEVELQKYKLLYFENQEDGYFVLKGYAEDDYCCGIENLFIWFEKDGVKGSSAYVTFEDGSCAQDVDAVLDGENTVTISWSGSEQRKGTMAENAGSVSFQFIPSEDGCVIYDGEKLYYYKAWEYDDGLLESIDGDEDTNYISDNDRVEIIETQQMVVSELKDGFSIAGINATVDDKTGKVTMDNSILFDFDSDKLSPEGEAYLDKFLEVYAKVMAKQSDEGRVITVKVVGHTDVSGSYDYNLDLSQRRAESVVSYCSTKYPELADMIKAEGKSYSEPVYNEDGTVNMDASRRVEFKAILQY